MQQEVVTGASVATVAFIKTSIDNNDGVITPGKTITPGNQNWGFHRTSVQHIAPKPLSCTLST